MLFRSDLGELTGDASKLEEACGKYAQATAIDPEYAVAYSNWGTALSEVGKMVDDSEQARTLFLEGRDKATRAERIAAGTGAYNLACISALLGEPQECRRWLGVAQEHKTIPGCEHLRTDEDLDPVREEPWFQEILATVCEGEGDKA